MTKYRCLLKSWKHLADLPGLGQPPLRSRTHTPEKLVCQSVDIQSINQHVKMWKRYDPARTCLERGPSRGSLAQPRQAVSVLFSLDQYHRPSSESVERVDILNSRSRWHGKRCFDVAQQNPAPYHNDQPLDSTHIHTNATRATTLTQKTPSPHITDFEQCIAVPTLGRP